MPKPPDRDDDAAGPQPAERQRSLPSWLVNRTALVATRLVQEAFASAGMRRYHYAVLSSLAEYGPATQAGLSRRTEIDRSDMAAVAAELEAGGLVEREPDPANRRRNIVTITAAGRRTLRRLDRLVEGAEDELLAPLSAAERERLAALLDRLYEHHASR